MKFRPTKSSGRFNFEAEGGLELFFHMEADPGTLSYAEFNFETALKDKKFRPLAGLTAYLLRHTAGLFVIAIESTSIQAIDRIQALWQEADLALAKRDIWLLSTTCESLRREPQWTTAREITRASQAEEVAPADRARVVEFLSIAGQATLIECARLCEESFDSCDAILKLISIGTLQLAEDGPLSTAAQLCLFTPPDPDLHCVSIGDSYAAGSR
jgi:hypothetical protein